MRAFLSKLIGRLAIVKHLACSEDWLLTLYVAFFAIAVPVLLRLKLVRLQSLLEPAEVAAAADAARVKNLVGRIESVLQLGGPLSHHQCLSRGLTLFYFLRREGVDVSLCFGMGKVAGEFAGHCWLVKDGEPFLEAKDPRPIFTKIHSIPERQPLSPPPRTTY
jgi:Transglutaminase-like superfamily